MDKINKKIKTVKKNIYYLIEPREGHLFGMIYDFTIALFAILSVLPLFFESGQNAFIDWVYKNNYLFLSLFLLDYALRWFISDLRYHKGLLSYLIYPFGIWAIIDGLAIVPSLFGIRELQALIALRLLRVIRFFPKIDQGFRLVFRSIFNEIRILLVIFVSLFVVVFVGSIMIYAIEGGKEGSQITNYWDSIWFVFITITTIGYGDIVPVTVAGQILAMFFALIGISILALITATVVAGFNREIKAAKQRMEENTTIRRKHYFSKNEKKTYSYGVQVLYLEVAEDKKSTANN